jgi:phage-related protein
MAKPPPKSVIWMGDSREVLRDFPAVVQDEIGFALYRAQVGGKHVAAKPLRGFGSGVLELLSDHRGNTFRTVYTATPARELDLVKARLGQAEALHRKREKA